MLTYPAPERNKEPIREVLARVLPAQGRVLEIASGTGQHVMHFAQALPRLTWLPSDPEAMHRDAIRERMAGLNLPNVEPPVALDVHDRPWQVVAVDAIVCINMIHIAPWSAGLALLEEASRLLAVHGVLYLYGPYRREGAHTAPSNAAFDEDLRRRDARWGVRNLEDVECVAASLGLDLAEVISMPANNLSLVFNSRVGLTNPQRA